MESTAVKVIVTIFAIIGFLVVLGFIAMWMMHGSMMENMCN